MGAEALINIQGDLMLFESYMLITAIAFIFFILHLTVKITEQDERTGGTKVRERPIIFIIVSLILFFSLWGSSANIEKNHCENTVTEINNTVANISTYSNNIVCSADILDDFTMIYVFLIMAILSALLAIIRTYEMFGEV